MERHVNGAMAEKPNPVDYGVQIRFIDDLKEMKKPQKIRPKHSKPGSYGVAVRVQGIDGQPFVVLNSGAKGEDSFGVQIKSESKYGNPAHSQWPEQLPPNSLREGPGSISSDSDLPESRYIARHSQYNSQYSTSDEELSSQGYPRETRPVRNELPQRYRRDGSSSPQGSSRQLLPQRPFGEELRRTQSHSSLLSPNSEEAYGPSPLSIQTRGMYQSQSPASAKSSSTLDIAGRKRTDPRQESHAASGRRFVGRQPSPDPEFSRPWQPADQSDIDTKPLSSVDSLITKFDGKVQQRGRAARRSRISLEERKRSQSLDGRVSCHDTADSRELSAAQLQDRLREGPKGLATKQPGTANAPHTGSLNRAIREDLKENSVKAQVPRDWIHKSLEEPVVEQQQSQVQSELQQLKSTPDLLKDQQEVSPPGSSESTKALIYSILKDGSKESESSLKRKTNLMFEKIQALAVVPPEDTRGSVSQNSELKRKMEELQQKLDEETKLRQKAEQARSSAARSLESRLEEAQDECRRLKGALETTTQELKSRLQELKEVKVAREQAEDKLGDVEEQLMGMHEELDRLRKTSVDSANRDELMKELLETREELEEVLNAKQKQEEHLRLRERELTALKGALKEEVANHDKELDQVTQQYQRDMDQLRQNMEDVSQNQASLEIERQKINSIVRNLQKELEESNEETSHWREMFQKNKEELRSNKQELMQVKQEREEYEEELRELRERFSAMRVEVDQVRNSTVDAGQAEALKKELRQAQEELRELASEKQAQDELVHQRERELAALKGALQEEVASRDTEVEQLKQQFQKNLQQLRKDYDEAAKVKVAVESEKEATEQMRKAVESALRETQEENDDLRRKILGLEMQVKEYRHFSENWEGSEARLREKIAKLEADRRQMEQSLEEAVEQEQELLMAKKSLESRLEEAQRSLSRLSQEHQVLNTSHQEEMKQKEQLRRTKNELEEQKRLLDKTTEKLSRELDQMAQESHSSLAMLQSQLEEYKEKSRKEIADSQKQAKDRSAEVEKMQFTMGRLQDEITRLKQALQDSQAERESAVLDKEVLAQRLQSLEQEVESKKRSQDDRSRQVKVLEEKSKRLEVELDEERNTVELLTDRINRSRDQIDQLRAELLQERSSRQDLECDKISLERQNKDLKSRLASSEGLQKPSASLTQLESRIQELQDKLQAEEREKNILVSSNRKLERKVKELTIQIDDERQHVNDQKDQLSLRVKALKRQMDEAEEEIERLESARKKAQRELEEQHELNEQLQNRVKALEKEAWRKATRLAAEASLEDDRLSSDEEFDSAYGPSSIASLLTEGNLQTSSC
ncbi:cingulin [Chelonoidis abingdonii]|uniref:cingulin n=1 Tax=Chelonoidis abingdonii TaxID=106734 RepID=UPI0013F2216C|nr:cingulin isoform X1 [Chelonoidis abingdonii]XP_032623863.1 cingulin isoform X1 [Chelonoidis abingdonii]XP_032623864.1 cingulin isoform X1 [Chelonoidis abingdonii]XP_032623865.1 cingulin isoform X1 [Chelonoidis abingdonii]XP_032623866.1 cingulin isoform X1 [Chelonoidis abingdonii]XP_032623867.1 cingulin isoform X1 [Chelonoidis abingdonii]XP_032623868.1 cingulin isoform X1 [Chelonoidis abingdonii]